MKTNILDNALILIILGIFTSLGNAISLSLYRSGASFTTVFFDSIITMAILGGVSILAYLIVKVPGLSKLPVIFWASIIAALLCSPLFPYGKEVYALTEKVTIVPLSTVVLVYAGLSLGKDIEKFKTISWRIIPVALAVFTGTFLIAALIAQFTLQMSFPL